MHKKYVTLKMSVTVYDVPNVKVTRTCTEVSPSGYRSSKLTVQIHLAAKYLWRWSVSLCGSSVKGTWREGSLAGDPEEYLEKALEAGIAFHRGSVWGTWRRVRLPGTLRAA
jgi:hypothetical protein